MAVHPMTINLSETVYRQIKRAADAVRRPVDEVVAEAVVAAAPVMNAPASSLRLELAHMAYLNDAAAIDPQTGRMTPLFNPRLERWPDHFEWIDDGAVIRGKTAIGRSTVLALDPNHPDVVASRRLWASVGWHPPAD